MAIQKIISRAMRGFPLAVTNQLAKSEVIQPDMQDLFQQFQDVGYIFFTCKSDHN